MVRPPRTTENISIENHRDLFFDDHSVALQKLWGSLWPIIEIPKESEIILNVES
jgi:hypothetical protein